MIHSSIEADVDLHPVNRAEVAGQKIQLVLSFDHELFLGRNGSYHDELFAPTERLFRIAKSLDVPITLFTDVCCAMRFCEWDKTGFYDPYVEQLRSCLAAGHDVQLHIHPHWIDSEFQSGQVVPSTSYCLEQFAQRQPPNHIEGLIARGVEFLQSVAHGVADDYQCIAFRAGGLCFRESDERVNSALHDHGIRIESSIAPGFRFKCALWEVDHQKRRPDPNWTIPVNRPCGHRAGSGGLYEVPVISVPRTPWNNVPFLAKRLLYRHRRHHGHGEPLAVGNTGMMQKLKRMMPKSAWLLGFDHFAHSANDLMHMFRTYVAQYPHAASIACSSLSHPKLMGEHSFKVMSDFVRMVRDEYGESVEFTSFQKLYENFHRLETSESGGESL